MKRSELNEIEARAETRGSMECLCRTAYVDVPALVEQVRKMDAALRLHLKGAELCKCVMCDTSRALLLE